MALVHLHVANEVWNPSLWGSDLKYLVRRHLHHPIHIQAEMGETWQLVAVVRWWVDEPELLEVVRQRSLQAQKGGSALH
jgi:hypothetical protein